MLQATRPEAITGSTMSAAMRRMPTICIESPIVRPASPATSTFSARHRDAGDAARPPRRRPRRRAPGRGGAIAASPARPRTATTTQVLARDGEDRAEEEREEVDVEGARRGREHDARREARVEEERERLVADRLVARAQPLDADRAGHRGHERRQRRARCRAGSRRRRPANAVCPIPSPTRLMFRWTRKKPTVGARMPTTAPVAKASRMNSESSMGVRGVVPLGREGARAARRRRCRRARGRAARRCPRPRRTRGRRRASSRRRSRWRRSSSRASDSWDAGVDAGGRLVQDEQGRLARRAPWR